MSTSQANASTQAQEPTFHHDFASTQWSDFVLVAADGVRFRVDSHALRRASPIWDTMLSDVPKDQEQIVHLNDPSEPLAIILSLVSCKPLPVQPLKIKLIEPLLTIADKYQMDGPLSVIRKLAVTKEFFDENPLRAFRVAWALRWKEETKAASRKTLEFDLGDPKQYSLLKELEYESFLALLKLHWDRKRAILDFVDRIPNEIRCNWHDRSMKPTSETQAMLKGIVLLHIQAKPSGSSIVDGEFARLPAVISLEDSLKCGNCGSKRSPDTSVHSLLSRFILNCKPNETSFP